jgi:hypothetical protein
MTQFVSGSVYVVGFVAVLLLAVAVFLWLIEWFQRRVVIPWQDQQRGIGQHDVRDRLMRDANWFSEDPATYNLIVALAQDSSDVSRTHDIWREQRKAQP